VSFPATSRDSTSRKVPVPRLLFYGGCLAILFCLFVFSLGPANLGGIKHAWGNAAMQQARTINLAMFSYCNDNDQKYPDGKSSTEVFQKLMDGNYISDPGLFYLPLPGKIKGVGPKLKPENVCFDVTSGLEGNSPSELPVVFMTGYRVDYVPGGSAVAMIKPFPKNGEPQPPPILDSGIAITYKSNSAKFITLAKAPNGDVSIPNFISPDFKPDGKTYRQLTPEGPLP